MTAFDITPLQIPVADPSMGPGGGVDTMKYAISAHPGTLPRAKMSSACKYTHKLVYYFILPISNFNTTSIKNIL